MKSIKCVFQSASVCELKKLFVSSLSCQTLLIFSLPVNFALRACYASVVLVAKRYQW